jgi:precorrin-4/cobalt-precorrin-4 C11-methyltransferase
MARLHSGDLSIWSVVAEQMRRLDARGIAWRLTSGAPAFAAAAALGRELTIPEIAQSLVLTPVSGRASAMPAGETLGGCGALLRRSMRLWRTIRSTGRSASHRRHDFVL